MVRRILITGFFMIALTCGKVFPQAKSVFSGDPVKFSEELITFMGTTLTEEQKGVISSFIAKWDSAAFSKSNMVRILDLAGQLNGRQMRAFPNFSQFLKTLTDFCTYKRDDAFLSYWLTGLSEMLFNKRYSNESITKYIENTSQLIKENLLINSPSVKWKVKNADLKFAHDTVFQIIVKNATLTCYSARDSTEIYNVTGTYYPDLQTFHGDRGTVTWEKAGYPANDVFAEISDYTINVKNNTFTCDSARLHHKTYFREPILGILTDKAASTPSKERSAFPKFETYTKNFRIKDLYEGVNYEGGLAFEGAQVKGKGDRFNPAKIMLFRKNTLFVKVTSDEYIFTKASLNSQETAATIYLDKDSIYHSNLGFSFNAAVRQVNLFRTNNPVSPSPYYDSFHNIDMYFEYLSWDMESSKIIISRARGAALGEARFISSSFFNADYFLRLMSLDNYNPLTRLQKFSEWFYSETFPVSDFAKWLNKPEEFVTGLCIDMANKGFIFYDRANQEVTIKKKVRDFIDSYAGKKDYDVLSVYSETKAPVDNAELDLKTFDLRVRGVHEVFLSDSQRVAIFPKNSELTIEKNRTLRFDGVVEAGLFTIFGRDFTFRYDSFKIKLNKIDSIKVDVETDKRDAMGNPIAHKINSLIQMTTGEIYIDDPNNKSGLRSLSQYPMINAMTSSYIFYDRIPGLENVYKKENFYFKIDPFRFENIDHYSNKDLNLEGEFFGGNILKPMRQTLTVQDNNSLGFHMNIPSDGIGVYDDAGRLFDQVSMSNKGLIGGGTLKHITAVAKSPEFRFYPDSMVTLADTFSITRDPRGLFPDLSAGDVKIKWYPIKDEWFASNATDKDFRMFNNGTLLDGSLILSKAQVTGKGVVNMPESRVNSQSFRFNSNAIKADTADYYLKSPSTNGFAFTAENAAADIDFALKHAKFHLNTDSSAVSFPEIQYVSKMTDFDYDMQEKILSMEQKGRSSGSLMTPEKLLRQSFSYLDKPTFFSVNNLRDTIAFTSLKARYNVEKEFIEAEGISYIHVADALIQPDHGKLVINRRAMIDKLTNALIAVNNLHLIHSADITIESSKRYSGSGAYDYVTDNNEKETITLPELTVDTLTTSAKGFIPPEQKFLLSQAFTFNGDVSLSARSKFLTFTGSSGILNDCKDIESYPVKFKSQIDPQNVMIPLTEKPRDVNDNILVSGSWVNIDSAHVYPAFLSARKSWSDAGLVNATGVLYYNKAKSRYQISSPAKMVDPTLPGDLVALDRNSCMVSGEGRLNFGTNLGRVTIMAAGNETQEPDSGKVEIHAILALDFYFSPEALKVMQDEIRAIPTLKSVNLNSDFNNKSMKDLVGADVAGRLREEADLFGIARNMPKEFNYELLLNDVTLYWNDVTSSFRSKGRIGIGFVGQQPVNLYTDGYIEIQRRRSGDIIDIYLKAENSAWYYFSYLRGVMMAKAKNQDFNSIISSVKEKDRKDPDSPSKEPYIFTIAADNRINSFLRRMLGESEGDDQDNLQGIVR